MGRGTLTDHVQQVAEDRLGRKINVTELRLMPYVQYVMMNEQRIDPRKCNQDDRLILSLWRKEGHIDGGAGGLAITRNFWDAINEILWHSYVDYE